jgi:nucleotide-binding universal stress UspA family protein
MSTTKANPAKAARAAAAHPPGLAPKRILVPTDFSSTSMAALKYAVLYARQFGASLDLLHVLEPPPFLSDLKDVPLAMTEQEATKKATAELANLARREVDAAVPITPLVRSGKAYVEITEAARELQADLIVIATHGYTGLKHTLLGSVAERVIRHAGCPVLVVR